MGKYTQEQTEEKYKKLPKVLQDALYSTETASRLYNIGKKFELTIEQIGLMAEETGYVILGLTRPEEFAGILKSAVGIDDSKARDMAADISQGIFYPLRDVMKSAHGMNIDQASSPATKEVPPFMRGMQQPEGVSPNHNIIMPGGPAMSGSPAPQNRIPSVDLRVPSEIKPNPVATTPKPIIPAAPQSATPKPNMEPVVIPKSSEPVPISPILPAAKSSPIDLRPQAKQPSATPAEPVKNQPSANIPVASSNTLVIEKKTMPPATPAPTSTPPTATFTRPTMSAPVNKPVTPFEKKIPDKGIDPYREPVE